MTDAVMTFLSEQKRQLAEWLLPSCPFVLIDSTRPDVQVPASLVRDELVLRIGRHPQIMAMPDLVLDAVGWSATISVPGAQHRVSVSWAAISRMWVGEPFAGPMVIWPVQEVEDFAAKSTGSSGFRVLKGGKS